MATNRKLTVGAEGWGRDRRGCRSLSVEPHPPILHLGVFLESSQNALIQPQRMGGFIVTSFSWGCHESTTQAVPVGTRSWVSCVDGPPAHARHVSVQPANLRALQAQVTKRNPSSRDTLSFACASFSARHFPDDRMLHRLMYQKRVFRGTHHVPPSTCLHPLRAPLPAIRLPARPLWLPSDSQALSTLTSPPKLPQADRRAGRVRAPPPKPAPHKNSF